MRIEREGRLRRGLKAVQPAIGGTLRWPLAAAGILDIWDPRAEDSIEPAER